MKEQEKIIYEGLNKEVGALVNLMGWKITQVEEATPGEFYADVLCDGIWENCYEAVCFDGTVESFIKGLIACSERLDVNERVAELMSNGCKGRTINGVLKEVELYKKKLDNLAYGLKFALAISPICNLSKTR